MPEGGYMRDVSRKILTGEVFFSLEAEKKKKTSCWIPAREVLEGLFFFSAAV